MPKDNLDPLLADILDMDEPSEESAIAGESATAADDFDPVSDFIFRQQYGIDRPGSVPGPRTVAEIGKALDALREDLAVAPSEAKQAFFAKMAAAAEVYAPGTFAAHFLKGAAESDDLAMRKAVKRLVQEHKDEILVSGSLEKLLVVE